MAKPSLPLSLIDALSTACKIAWQSQVVVHVSLGLVLTVSGLFNLCDICINIYSIVCTFDGLTYCY